MKHKTAANLQCDPFCVACGGRVSQAPPTSPLVAKFKLTEKTVLLAVLGALAVLLGLAVPCTGEAAEFPCASGDVACLIDAINQANANGEANTITLAAGTYTLTAVDNIEDGPNGLPSVTSVLTIKGTGAENTIIERDANAAPFRLLHVAAAGKLTLEGLTLRGGFVLAAGGGAGILNNGGAVIITQSTLAANSTRAIGNGGGLLNNGGTVTIARSAIVANIAQGPRGAGIYNQGTLNLTNSTLAGNRTSSDGGAGIANDGTLIITDSIFTDNISGFVVGGIDSTTGTVTLTKSTLARNHAVFAGTIENHPGSTLTLTNSTLVGNSAEFDGGGIYNNGGLTMTNSTLTDNSTGAFGRGGGLWNNVGTATLTNCTLAGNKSGGIGGGIWNGAQDGGTVALQNTIVALNTGQGPDCFGPTTSLDNNLIGDQTGCAITLLPSDLTGDPGLGDFTDDGTPGHGHFPLLATSQAINAGNAAACPPADQLGQPRVGHCDIGAIEFQPAPANRCPLGQGFWKNQPTAWPVAALTLGSQTYTQDELLALFDTPPGGDASLILAHQLIAAKLNLANGSSPTPISGTISDTDNLLSGFGGKLPYHVRPSTTAGQAMTNHASLLDQYNSGALTPDCTP